MLIDLMNYVFQQHLDQFIILFIDDILTYFAIEEEHAQQLHIVL